MLVQDEQAFNECKARPGPAEHTHKIGVCERYEAVAVAEVLKREPTQAEAEAAVGLYREQRPLGRSPGGRRGGVQRSGAVALPGTRAGQVPVTRPDLSQLPEVVRAAQATSAAIQRENERIYDQLPKHELVMALLDRDSRVRQLDGENAALKVEIARVRLKAAKLSTRQANAVHKATDAFYLAGSAFLALVKKFDDEQARSYRPPEPTEKDASAYRGQVADSDDEIADEIVINTERDKRIHLERTGDNYTVSEKLGEVWSNGRIAAVVINRPHGWPDQGFEVGAILVGATKSMGISVVGLTGEWHFVAPSVLDWAQRFATTEDPDATR